LVHEAFNCTIILFSTDLLVRNRTSIKCDRSGALPKLSVVDYSVLIPKPSKLTYLGSALQV